MKFTEIELATLDLNLFFESNGQVMQVASNGLVHPKFQKIEVEEQDKLFAYFTKLKNTSEYTLTKEAKKYPITKAFTFWAKKGINSFDMEDMENENAIGVAVPKSPIKVEDLPSDIRKLLTKF